MSAHVLDLALSLGVLAPLLVAGALALRPMRPAALALAPWAAFPALLLAVFGPTDAALSLPWLLLGSELGLDETARVFLLFTSLLWLISGVYACGYLAGEDGRADFFAYFLVAMAGNLGLILAQDLASFYLCFALMSFASYGLVVHERTKEALRAGRVYILLVVVGEIALFAALVLAMSAADATDFASVRRALAAAESRDLILALALVGFGIKAGVLALHVWLPLAHPVAPTPASAVLSGAMIKAGLLGWLRLLPLGELALPDWGAAFVLLGLAAAFYGVGVGLTQRDPKTLLAYSSISQMGTLTLAVGLALMAPELYPALASAIGLYALHHGLAKGALFLGVGVVRPIQGKQKLRTWLALWVPALAIAGAPFTSGMLAKTLVKAEALGSPAPWDWLVPALLPWVALATSLLLGRFLLQMARAPDEAGQHGPTRGMIAVWLILILTVALVPWWTGPVPAKLWSVETTLASAWPVLLAVPLVLGAARLAQRSRLRLPSIPAGDLLVPVGLILGLLLRAARWLSEVALPAARKAVLSALGTSRTGLDWGRLGRRMEAGLSAWTNALMVLLLLGVIAALLGASHA
jgi:formate hydrogenlyase subunit 3/multisubunit Na+/H+ antiporter MnhD subunit